MAVNDVGGPLRGLRYRVDFYESPVLTGEEDRLISTTDIRDLVSGLPVALASFQGNRRRVMHPIKVTITALEGDPTSVGDAILGFRLRRPVARATIQD